MASSGDNRPWVPALASKKMFMPKKFSLSAKCLPLDKFLKSVVRVQLGWGGLWMPQVLCVTVAARPSLSHSLQVDGEEETEALGQQQAGFSISRHKDQSESDAGGCPVRPSQPCLCSLSVRLGLLGKPLFPYSEVYASCRYFPRNHIFIHSSLQSL